VNDPERQIVLVRHGETEWARLGRHTGRTDVSLTEVGREQARGLVASMTGEAFTLVLCSPLQRARETCALAGFGHDATLDDDLMEWDYGDAEGRTLNEIRVERPGWSPWSDEITGGESLDEVAQRADRVIDRIAAAPAGPVALFAHGHLLRVLAARWLAQPACLARHLSLQPAGRSRLGIDRGTPVLLSWNEPPR